MEVAKLQILSDSAACPATALHKDTLPQAGRAVQVVVSKTVEVHRNLTKGA